MARENVVLPAFNRGLISPLALGRVDLDRTRLSASIMTNWLPKTQGAMRIRPGTKYRGSSINDTGAYFIEFVARTTDGALLELTKNKMRIWDADTGTIGLLGRPNVGEWGGQLSLSARDTGWKNTSTGGVVNILPFNIIPEMTSNTSGVITVSASNADADGPAWHAADVGGGPQGGEDWNANSAVPEWWKIDFGSGVTKRLKDFSITATSKSGELTNTPKDWIVEASNNDADWTTIVTVEDGTNIVSQTGWSINEKRLFSDTGWTDTGSTGTPSPGGLYRYWRVNVSAVNGGSDVRVANVEMFEDSGTSGQASFNAQGIVLNATSIGSLARAHKRVMVTDTGGHQGTEHALDIRITRGPVTCRVGSTENNDDYISETSLSTGYHNLAFTPDDNFHIVFQNDLLINRIVGSIDISDTGTVEITAPWAATDIDNIRFDQSADVVFVDCNGVQQHKIERRGTGRSWSVVEYAPNDGPFLAFRTSKAKLKVAKTYGNTTLTSNYPFFKSVHVGSLFRLYHSGQSGVWPLGAEDTHTDAIKITGIGDTGHLDSASNERTITFVGAGTFTATIHTERSFDAEDIGFHDLDTGGTVLTDNSPYTRNYPDKDDNVVVWTRQKIKPGNYTSGVVEITATYDNGQTAGICRITGFKSNTEVEIEVLDRFSSTEYTDDWQEGYWSSAQGYPDAVALHEGRLGHVGGATWFMSVSDDYESFDDTVIGESAPIIRTIGSGPVDRAFYMLSLSRLIVGTTGAEMSFRSSSLDEPLTPENSSSKPVSTRGSANIRALAIDKRGFFIQRSKQRVYSVGYGESVSSVGDYISSELTLLVPDLLKAGVVSIAVQRQPDTRLHCVLGDGKVAILTYEPQEEVLCWSLWETDGTVERAMVLPGTSEDKVFYHINRTIDSSTKRYLEEWALESECQGDTGLSWIMDCAASYTEAGGKSANPKGFQHLAGKKIIAWGSDTGQLVFGKDLSADTGTQPGTSQQTYYVNTASDTGDTGKVGLTGQGSGVHHFVGGLAFDAKYQSTKLAYAAQFGTALAQLKRGDKIGFVLDQVHNNGLFFGSDTGNLDPMPRVVEGATVDPDTIHTSWDKIAMPFPGLWDTDSRIYLKGKAPRPVTVMAAIPTIITNEK